MMLLAFLAASSCDSGPRYTSQQVMLEIDAYRKDLEQGLSRAATLKDSVAAAEAIERWMKDPALERYLERRDLPADPSLFQSGRSKLETALAAFLQAARAGDADAARRAYPAVQDACSQCHVSFRPDLLLLPR